MEQQGDHILPSPLPPLPFKCGYVFLVILKYCNPRNDLLKSGSFPGTPVYRVSQEEGAKLRESVPYVEIYRYNPKHLYPKLNGYGDNGQRSLKL